MSVDVASAVRRRVIGSPTLKAVLLLMADAASDDGSGIWMSKGNIARDLELSKRAVQSAVSELVSKGIIREAGQKACPNGYTVEYAINLAKIAALPSTRETPTSEAAAPVQDVHPCSTFTPTRAARSPLPVQDVHPNRPLEPSLEPSINTREARASSLHEIEAMVGKDRARDFAALRKSLRAPLTPTAVKQIVKKLAASADPCGDIDRAIENGWRTVWPKQIPVDESEERMKRVLARLEQDP